jgi:hypothetical protein
MAIMAAGCAQDTSVLTIGSDSYRVQSARAPVLGGGLAAQEAALSKATTYCSDQKKQILVLGTSKPRGTRYEVDFKCLKPGDPAFTPSARAPRWKDVFGPAPVQIESSPLPFPQMCDISRVDDDHSIMNCM